jgi:ER membrane protein complex subunit 2
MSIDLVHPPPSPSPELSLKISQQAPQVIKNTSATSIPWPFSLLMKDQSADAWTSLETLFMQCLRTGDDKAARDILDRLQARFGERNERVMAYQGMWEEATAQSEEELKKLVGLYAKLLENDPANIVSVASQYIVRC